MQRNIASICILYFLCFDWLQHFTTAKVCVVCIVSRWFLEKSPISQHQHFQKPLSSELMLLRKRFYRINCKLSQEFLSSVSVAQITPPFICSSSIKENLGRRSSQLQPPNLETLRTIDSDTESGSHTLCIEVSSVELLVCKLMGQLADDSFTLEQLLQRVQPHFQGKRERGE